MFFKDKKANERVVTLGDEKARLQTVMQTEIDPRAAIALF